MDLGASSQFIFGIQWPVLSSAMARLELSDENQFVHHSSWCLNKSINPESANYQYIATGRGEIGWWITRSNRRSIQLVLYFSVRLLKHWMTGATHGRIQTTCACVRRISHDDIRCPLFLTCSTSEGVVTELLTCGNYLDVRRQQQQNQAR